MNEVSIHILGPTAELGPGRVLANPFEREMRVTALGSVTLNHGLWGPRAHHGFWGATARVVCESATVRRSPKKDAEEEKEGKD